MKLPDDSRWLFRAFDRNDSLQKIAKGITGKHDYSLGHF